jgi:hypothetical protein
MQLGFHGSILADWTIHGRLPVRSSSIKSWDNKGFATKTGAEMRAFLKGDKRTAYWHEAVYSNAVGPRSYVLFIVPYSIDGTTVEHQREVIRKARVEMFDYLGRVARAA